MNTNLPHTSICMVRPTLSDLPAVAPPVPYAFRPYAPGDEAAWVRIHELSDPLNTAELALFEREFGHDAEALRRRQLYLCDGQGEAVGTITAWHNTDFPDRAYGRVHWVAIVPAHQGAGLGKPLLAACLHRMVELGCEGAYLTTNAPRILAIGLYLRFGFRPRVRSEAEREPWRRVAENVRPELAGLVRAALEDA